MGKRHSSEFNKGYKEVNRNVKESKVISGMYSKAKELSDNYGKGLADIDKGYVAGVADRLMDNWKGRALNGAELYGKTGLLQEPGVKEDVADKLATDLAKTNNAQYLKEVKTFMNSNGMEKFARGINLEHAVMNAGRKKLNVIPLALIGMGILLSGLRLTGAAIGSPGFGSLAGTGLFFAGIIWTVVSVEQKRILGK